MGLGIYIHIPYCVRKCGYCDFNSYPDMKDTVSDYFNILISEINEFPYKKCKNNVEYTCVDTIFIGGGTPSSVDPEYITAVLETINQTFRLTADCEISIEVNPGTVTEYKLKEYKKAGINRISIGLQSAVDSELSLLGRIHTYDNYKSSLNYIVKQGFTNINTDLIFGIPGQTEKSFQYTLNRIFDENMKYGSAIKHISVYGLIIEEGTPFYALQQKNLLNLPDEDAERRMYEIAVEYLKKNGFKQYEISNFAINGYQCKHNIKYWKTEEYLGFGVSAHSYTDGKRCWHYGTIDSYINNGKHGKYTEGFEDISKTESMKEFMMLGLRMTDGIDTNEFFQKYGVSCNDIFAKEITELTGKNIIAVKGNRISLTRTGLDFANLAFMEFV